MTHIGIQISSVRKYLQTPADVLDSFRKVSAIGYRVIQIQWISPAVPAQFIGEALKETGLVCVGTQDYYDEVTARWDEVIAENDLWGGTNICVSGIPERCRSYDGCLDFARQLNQRAASLAPLGKVLSFHPRAVDVLPFASQNALASENSLDLLLERTDPRVQFVLDIYHLVKAGLDPVDWLRRAQGRCDLVHFKDRRINADGSETLMPVGQGSIAWAPVIRACQASGVQYAFAEQESWHKDPFECLKESYEYMTRLGII